MAESYTFFDATYTSFMDTTSGVDYEARLFEFHETSASVTTRTNDPFSLDSTPYDPSLLNLSAPYDPNDLIPPMDFQDFLGDDWAEGLLNLIEAPVEPPTQLTTPPQSLPSTPKMTPKLLPLEVTDFGLLSPPPSDRPMRTRRYNKYEDIYRLAQLNINAPVPVEQTIDPASILPPPAYTLEPSDVQPMAYDYNTVCPSVFDTPKLLYPPSDSEMSSPNVPGSSRGSPSPERRQSYPTRPTRSSGVQRVIVSDLRGARRGQPVPTGDPERPHGCRHPGRFPGDLPCNLDFARKHDWSRHQVSTRINPLLFGLILTLVLVARAYRRDPVFVSWL